MDKESGELILLIQASAKYDRLHSYLSNDQVRFIIPQPTAVLSLLHEMIRLYNEGMKEMEQRRLAQVEQPRPAMLPVSGEAPVPIPQQRREPNET